jgi:hypothetical protein
MSGHRVQITVFLESQVHRAAKQRSVEMKLSLSATVAEAAKESLLSTYRSDREKEILKAADRNLHALRRLEQRMRIELQVLKELIGLGMRSFFNHLPAVPESGKTAALLSGKQRFQRYLDLVAANLRGGDSILADVPLLGPAEEATEGDAPERATPQSHPDALAQDRTKANGDSRTNHQPSNKRARNPAHDTSEQGLFATNQPKGNHGT